MSRINLQPKEKQSLSEHGILDVHSVWETIQGEGPYAGTPAVFVRLAGCNLDCPGCDTEYTSQRKLFNPEQLVDLVRKTRGPALDNATGETLIVITGGEPFRQNFAPFAMKAVYAGYRIQVETNGTLWFEEFYPSRFDVVCSPKTPVIRPELRRYIRALKYVVQAGHIDSEDGLPTSILENGLRPARPWEGFEGEVYIQPYDETALTTMENITKNTVGTIRNREAAVEVCMKFGYKFCLQVHKVVGLP